VSVSEKPLVVIAIGGNSLIKDKNHITVLDQLRATGETSHYIAAVLDAGYRVVITHGNGPQVGFMLLRSDAAKEVIHQVPLESLVADTQGATGFQISMTLSNELRRWDLDTSVVTLVTQVLVDPDDPAFKNPSKPIGVFYTEKEARFHEKESGWLMKEDAGRGWRRVVASPSPMKIMEESAIRKLVDDDIVVVACGGGGIPVMYNEYNDLIGCPAVIDKDNVSSMLASNLNAQKLIISTAVDKVAINFGTKQQEDLSHITIEQTKQYMEEGQFAPGSMKPKIQAALAFLEAGGEEVIITQPHHMKAALLGEEGTHITA